MNFKQIRSDFDLHDWTPELFIVLYMC